MTRKTQLANLICFEFSLKSCIEGINLLEEGKTGDGLWGVTKKEGRCFLKIKFYTRVILSFWGVTRITLGVIRKTLLVFFVLIYVQSQMLLLRLNEVLICLGSILLICLLF